MGDGTEAEWVWSMSETHRLCRNFPSLEPAFFSQCGRWETQKEVSSELLALNKTTTFM